MKYLKNIKLVGCFLLALLVIGLVAAHKLASSSADRLLVLVPDGMKFSDPRVVMWVDAGNEEGLHALPDWTRRGPLSRDQDTDCKCGR